MRDDEILHANFKTKNLDQRDFSLKHNFGILDSLNVSNDIIQVQLQYGTIFVPISQIPSYTDISNTFDENIWCLLLD